MNLSINFIKAFNDHDKALKKMAKKMGVDEYTEIDKETAKNIRRDFVRFLEDHWTEYVVFSKY